MLLLALTLTPTLNPTLTLNLTLTPTLTLTLTRLRPALRRRRARGAAAPRRAGPARRCRGGVARLRWWRPLGDAAAAARRRRTPSMYILLLRLPRAGQAATTQRRWDPSSSLSPSPNPNPNLRPNPLALARTLTRTRARTRAREARCESQRRAQASSPRAAAAGRRRRHRSVLGQASAAAQPPYRPQDAAGLARRGPLHSLRLQLRRRRLLRWRGSAPLGRLYASRAERLLSCCHSGQGTGPPRSAS